MSFVRFWRERFNKPFGQIFWSYWLFGICAPAVTDLICLMMHTKLPRSVILAQIFLMLPYLVGIPPAAILLLVRERRLLWFLRRFWALWLVSLCWPCYMYAYLTDVQIHGYLTKTESLALITWIAIIMPLGCYWFVLMHKRRAL